MLRPYHPLFFLNALETADRTQPAEVEAKTERLTEKIKKLREQMKQLGGSHCGCISCGASVNAFLMRNSRG